MPVKTAAPGIKPADHASGRSASTTKDMRPWTAMYLRIIVHDNEHMGQLIAYARMMGVGSRPWSKGE